MTRHRSTLGRARSSVAVAALSIGAMILATVPGVALTNASWNDTEWDHAGDGTNPGIGVLDCLDNDLFATRGAGQLLDGNVLAIDLDALAEVEGVVVTNDGTTSSDAPATSVDLGNDAYANPLGVSALSAINLALTGLLQLPLATNTGVYNQYGQAKNDGHSAGASGIVNDSGGIAATEEPPGSDVPTFATLNLGTVLSTALGQSVGNLVTNLADLDLRVGAVAGVATLDACNALWDEDTYANLVRDYLVAGLDLDLDSPLVGDLVSTVQSTLDGLETTVDNVAGNAGLLNSLTGAVTSALGPLLGTLGLGTPTATLALTVDFSAVENLLTTPIADASNIVSIDLATGLISVDIAKLFDSVNGLNNQAPNTQLLIDDAIINALTAAVGSALADWVTDVTTGITDALDLINVDLDVTIPISLGLDLGTITVGVDASLASLLDGSAAIQAGFAPDGLICGTLPAACGLVNTLVTAVTTTLGGTLGPAIGGLVDTALDTAVGTTVTLLGTNLGAITAPLVTMLGSSLSFLFGEDAALSVLLNAQNAPDPADAVPGNVEPAWAAGMPAPSVSPFLTGQFDVSAIRIVILGLVGGVGVDLAHASVGTSGLAP